MPLILALVVVLVGTLAVMHVTRHKILKAPPTVAMYGLVVCAGIVGANVYGELQAQREFDACVTAVSRSVGNRAQHMAISLELRDAGLIAVADRLDAELNVNLPERSLDECGDAP